MMQAKPYYDKNPDKCGLLCSLQDFLKYHHKEDKKKE
jgi:hypothetical protein